MILDVPGVRSSFGFGRPITAKPNTKFGDPLRALHLSFGVFPELGPCPVKVVVCELELGFVELDEFAC